MLKNNVELGFKTKLYISLVYKYLSGVILFFILIDFIPNWEKSNFNSELLIYNLPYILVLVIIQFLLLKLYCIELHEESFSKISLMSFEDISWTKVSKIEKIRFIIPSMYKINLKDNRTLLFIDIPPTFINLASFRFSNIQIFKSNDLIKTRNITSVSNEINKIKNKYLI